MPIMCEAKNNIGVASCYYCTNPEKSLCLNTSIPWSTKTPEFVLTGQMRVDRFSARLEQTAALNRLDPRLLREAPQFISLLPIEPAIFSLLQLPDVMSRSL